MHRVFGADLVNPLLGLLEEVQVALGMGVGEYVQAKIAQLKELAGALPNLLNSLRGTIVNAAVNFVAGTAIKKAVQKLLTFLVPGGFFFRLVELVWKAAQWLFSQFQRLRKLFGIVSLVFRPGGRVWTDRREGRPGTRHGGETFPEGSLGERAI